MEAQNEWVEWEVECLNDGALPLGTIGISQSFLRSMGKTLTFDHILEAQVRWLNQDAWRSFKVVFRDGTDAYLWIAANRQEGLYSHEGMERDEAWLVVRFIFRQGAVVNQLK
jgi:hypothetical protein